MIPANFDYEAPRNLTEALNLLQSHEDAKILAGGHSLLPAMKLRLAQPTLLVDIGRIKDLSYIREAGDRWTQQSNGVFAARAVHSKQHVRLRLQSLCLRD